MFINTMLIRPFEGFDDRIMPFLEKQEMQCSLRISDEQTITEVIQTLQPIYSIDAFVISSHQKRTSQGGMINGLMVFDEIMNHPILCRRFEHKRFILVVTQFGEITFRHAYYADQERYKNRFFILYESQMHQKDLPHRLKQYLDAGTIIIPSPA